MEKANERTLPHLCHGNMAERGHSMRYGYAANPGPKRTVSTTKLLADQQNTGVQRPQRAPVDLILQVLPLRYLPIELSHPTVLILVLLEKPHLNSMVGKTWRFRDADETAGAVLRVPDHIRHLLP
jgi:hypothetical protein